VAVLIGLAACSAKSQPQQQRRATPANRAEAARQLSGDGACAVKELKKSDLQGFKVYAPDGNRFLLNKEDQEGTAQVYLGHEGSSNLTCITCDEQPNGPKRKRLKMQPRWHPSGKWIFMAVERDQFKAPPLLGLSRSYVEGQLQNGIWTNMWAVSPDGKQWHRLTDFKSGVAGAADGYTGPALTRDGKKAAWSQIVDGNIFQYTFGKWEIILADYEEQNGAPRLTNRRNITPKGMNWNEVGTFHPDNETLLFSGSDQKDAQGMDIYTLNVKTGELRNLTNSPTVWDEHGIWSPDGKKVLFMSAHPYRNDPGASKILSIRTEFMLLDVETGDLTQLTRFRQKGSPEYADAGTAANGSWSPDGRSVSLKRLYFPKYEYWQVEFSGPCGNER
jgi:Tol biopolymer transport system component